VFCLCGVCGTKVWIPDTYVVYADLLYIRTEEDGGGPVLQLLDAQLRVLCITSSKGFGTPSTERHSLSFELREKQKAFFFVIAIYLRYALLVHKNVPSTPSRPRAVERKRQDKKRKSHCALRLHFPGYSETQHSTRGIYRCVNNRRVKKKKNTQSILLIPQTPNVPGIFPLMTQERQIPTKPVESNHAVLSYTFPLHPLY
jgi:hypothetical protein